MKRFSWMMHIRMVGINNKNNKNNNNNNNNNSNGIPGIGRHAASVYGTSGRDCRHRRTLGTRPSPTLSHWCLATFLDTLPRHHYIRQEPLCNVTFSSAESALLTRFQDHVKTHFYFYASPLSPAAAAAAAACATTRCARSPTFCGTGRHSGKSSF